MHYSTAQHAMGKAQTIAGALVVPASPSGWLVIVPRATALQHPATNVIALRKVSWTAVTFRDRVA